MGARCEVRKLHLEREVSPLVRMRIWRENLTRRCNKVSDMPMVLVGVGTPVEYRPFTMHPGYSQPG